MLIRGRHDLRLGVDVSLSLSLSLGAVVFMVQMCMYACMSVERFVYVCGYERLCVFAMETACGCVGCACGCGHYVGVGAGARRVRVREGGRAKRGETCRQWARARGRARARTVKRERG